MTIPSPIAHTVQQTQEWLKELRDNADLADEAEALSVLRSVLHQLRDRLNFSTKSPLSFYRAACPLRLPPGTSLRLSPIIAIQVRLQM